MTAPGNSLALAAPEAILVVTGLLVFLADAFLRVRKRALGSFALLGLAASCAASVVLWGRGGVLFDGSYTVDALSAYVRVLACLIGIFAILLCLDSFPEGRSMAGELYGFMMLVVTGVMVMASASGMVTFLLGLELVSIPLYVLAAFGKFRPFSTEAGMKYFVNGAFASGVLVYGLSLLFGTVGSTRFDDLARAAAHGPLPEAMLLGVFLVLGALAFKIAAAPFHMWAPDVYQGALTPITAFISCAPKAAGIAVLIRLFAHTLQALPRSEAVLTADWSSAVVLLSLLSMTVGNLAALRQTDIKRMMAYSGISQAGYILVGLSCASEAGAAAALFYVFVYCLASLAAFGAIVAVESATGSTAIEDMAGLAERAPGAALALLVALLSLAGTPPLSGFLGKFQLFVAAYREGLYLLVLAAVLNSVASLFYYLGVLRVVYFRAPSTPGPLPLTPAQQAAVGACALGAALFGLFPPLTQWAHAAARLLFSAGP